jgi:protoporphyrinogen oxidase
LRDLGTDWQGRFVPKPAPEELLYGALSDQRRFFGYNATFRYPVRGGIQTLPDALAARVPELELGVGVRRVDLSRKTALLSDGRQVRWERLVNTMPLKHFLGICDGLPAAVRAASEKLVYNTVYNLNLGVRRADVSDKHWVYFPEPKFPFYRVGFPMNFSKRLGPSGASSLYVEIARRPGSRFDRERAEAQVLEGLRLCGLLKKGDRIDARLWLPIECAYVVYDRDRAPAMAAIMPWLNAAGVQSIGRYGAWKYSFMEEAVLDGKRCAERLLGRAEEKRAPGSAEKELQPLK